MLLKSLKFNATNNVSRIYFSIFIFKAYLREQSISDTVSHRDETLPITMSSAMNGVFVVKVALEKLKNMRTILNHWIKFVVSIFTYVVQEFDTTKNVLALTDALSVLLHPVNHP